MQSRLFSDVLKQLAMEMSLALERLNEPLLDQQIGSLRILEYEISGPSNAVAIYTEPKPPGAYGPTHRNIQMDVRRGMVVLDIVDDRIACVEVLGRGDVRALLRDLNE